MRLEVGVDVVAMERIERAVGRFGERFLRRVFTPGELEYSMAGVHKWEHLAARFAAKEAASKALGTGMAGVGWTEFEVYKLPSGKPELRLHGRAAAKAAELGLTTWAVSLAHDADSKVAVATVVASGPGTAHDPPTASSGE